MNIIEKIFNILSTFTDKVYQHGTIAEDAEYPNEFITYEVTDSDEDSFDDCDFSTTWNINVFYYASDPQNVYKKAQKIRTELMKNDFVSEGKGFQIPSDVETHVGWALEFQFLECEE